MARFQYRCFLRFFRRNLKFRREGTAGEMVLGVEGSFADELFGHESFVHGFGVHRLLFK